MTLTTHAAFGAALAQLTPHSPVTGFVVGFASHFVLDAIPHWDYPLASHTGGDDSLDADMQLGQKFVFDLSKIALDVLLGLALVLTLPRGLVSQNVLLVGALGAMLPDALQFAYFKLRGPLLTPLQRFHLWIHTDIRIKNVSVGAGSQIVLLGMLWWFMLFLLA